MESLLDTLTSKKPRTQEEIDEDVELFINHPLNVKEITPAMLL
jgi:hypothetical protein